MTYVDARWTRTCAVPPSPELRDRWNSELERARKGAKGKTVDSIGLERKPRRLGFDDGVIIPPDEYPVGTPLAAIRRAAADRTPLSGTVRVAVILVDFSDKAMTATQSHFNDLFFSTGVLPHGSVKEYYNEVTNGQIQLAGTVVGPYRMPHTLAWYANNNAGIGKGGGEFRSPQLALDAAVAADPNVNFGPYDNDGNGFVDAFIVVHAGPGAEVTGSMGDIWSHKSTLATAYSTDNTKIFGYLTIPEDAKIGVASHELGHLLFGFPDLYDTDYTSEGIGNWCLMAGGTWNGGGDVPAHPSAWCKVGQGWASVNNVTTASTVTIADVKTSHQVLRLWKDGGSGPEYFLVENRQRTGFDANLPGDGLLVWHIDENQPGNTDENHYKVALLQADGNRDLELNHNRGDAGDPYPGSGNKTSVSSSTTPSTKSYAGADTCVSITSISPSGATMSAAVAVHCGKTIIKDGKETYKDIKDAIKEGKELHKELQKEHKELKEYRKEIFKERKDVKEFEKRTFEKHDKEIAEKPGDQKFSEKFDWPGGGGGLRGGGGLGGGGGLRGFGAESTGELAELESRVAALEAALGGSAEPFIGSELRPDLLGAPSTYDDVHMQARLAAGDPGAKREFDAPTT